MILKSGIEKKESIEKTISDYDLAQRLIYHDVGYRKWTMLHSVFKKMSFLEETTEQELNKSFVAYKIKFYQSKTAVKLFKVNFYKDYVLVRLRERTVDDGDKFWIMKKIYITDKQFNKLLKFSEIRKKFALREEPNLITYFYSENLISLVVRNTL